VHSAFETVKSFFYVCHIGEHDEQNILNLKFVLFCLKRDISTKQLTITYFFVRKLFGHRYFKMFYFFIIFVGLSKICIIFIFLFSHVCATLLSCNCQTPPEETMHTGFTVHGFCIFMLKYAST
jgi:hypothetical protein